MNVYSSKFGFLAAATFGLALTATFTACGDDNTTEVTEQTGMNVLAKGEKLPDCTKDNDGDILYVADSANAYYCIDSKWTILNGKNGEQGEPGTSAESKSGTSCTAETVKEGIKISCDGKVVGTINNGEPGKSATGKNGDDCTIDDSKGDGSVVVTCGTGKDAKTVTLYKALCGTQSYDPATHYCLNLKGEKKIEALLIDDRNKNDVQKYKTVTIEGSYDVTDDESNNKETIQYKKVWMAENINYSTNSDAVTNSWCGGGKKGSTDKGDCNIYGRFYTWDAAQTVCPDGWHLPSIDEWLELNKVAGGDNPSAAFKSTSGWYEDGNGDDTYGFSVLPAGYRDQDGIFQNISMHAAFWTPTEDEDENEYAIPIYFEYANSEIYVAFSEKLTGYAVRCIKD